MSITALSKDILVPIFNQLPKKDKMACMRACKSWHELICRILEPYKEMVSNKNLQIKNKSPRLFALRPGDGPLELRILNENFVKCDTHQSLLYSFDLHTAHAKKHDLGKIQTIYAGEKYFFTADASTVKGFEYDDASGIKAAPAFELGEKNTQYVFTMHGSLEDRWIVTGSLRGNILLWDVLNKKSSVVRRAELHTVVGDGVGVGPPIKKVYFDRSASQFVSCTSFNPDFIELHKIVEAEVTSSKIYAKIKEYSEITALYIAPSPLSSSTMFLGFSNTPTIVLKDLNLPTNTKEITAPLGYTRCNDILVQNNTLVAIYRNFQKSCISYFDLRNSAQPYKTVVRKINFHQILSIDNTIVCQSFHQGSTRFFHDSLI